MSFTGVRAGPFTLPPSGMTPFNGVLPPLGNPHIPDALAVTPIGIFPPHPV